MSLKILEVYRNEKITEQGTKHLNLEELYALDNNNITYNGYKHMNLKVVSTNDDTIL